MTRNQSYLKAPLQRLQFDWFFILRIILFPKSLLQQKHQKLISSCCPTSRNLKPQKSKFFTFACEPSVRPPACNLAPDEFARNQRTFFTERNLRICATPTITPGRAGRGNFNPSKALAFSDSRQYSGCCGVCTPFRRIYGMVFELCCKRPLETCTRDVFTPLIFRSLVFERCHDCMGHRDGSWTSNVCALISSACCSTTNATFRTSSNMNESRYLKHINAR